MKRFYKRLVYITVTLVLWVGWVDVVPAVTPWGPMSKIESAARNEGELVIYAAPGHINRKTQRLISGIFKEKYGISIAWTTLSPRDISPRVLAEQRTKQYTVDIVMSGIAGNYTVMKSKGYVEPILAPSSLEKGVWRLDPAMAMPKDRDWLFISMPLRPSFLINTNLVRSGEEPKGYQDLLDPKWKGKIVFQTPSRGGTGSGWFRATHRQLGHIYMRALAKQVVLVPKVNDTTQGVVRGQYPIGLAASTTRTRRLIEQGAPVKFIHPKEGGHMSVQGLELITNTPHPNAAKLFFQWFYTREGQMIYAPNTNAISVRKDIAQDYIPEGERYFEGSPYLVADPEDYTPKNARMLLKLGKKIFELGQ